MGSQLLWRHNTDRNGKLGLKCHSVPACRAAPVLKGEEKKEGEWESNSGKSAKFKFKSYVYFFAVRL